VLGVPVTRLLGHTGRADADGVAVLAGWTRLWHGPSLPGWWAALRADPRMVHQRRRDVRVDRVRELVAGGSTVAVAAAVFGVTERTAYRYLATGRARD